MTLEDAIKHIIHRMRKQSKVYYIGNFRNKQIVEDLLNIKTEYKKTIEFNDKNVTRIIAILTNKAYSVLIKSSTKTQPRRY